MNNQYKQGRHAIICLLVLFTGMSFANDHLPSAIDHNGESYAKCNDYLLRYGFVIKVVAGNI